MTSNNSLSFLDRCILQGDRVLRTLAPGRRTSYRTSPAHSTQTSDLTAAEIKVSAALMRVNHTGEVCAQALYQGQALTAQLPEVRQQMEASAAEEMDHLVWCEQRLEALNSHPSLLNPLWYGLSFGLGAAAGAISDKLSLGFLAATEAQVAEHLKEHLAKLPVQDLASRAIVQQMLTEEETHGHNALKAGGYVFPKPVHYLMRATSKIMTKASAKL